MVVFSWPSLEVYGQSRSLCSCSWPRRLTNVHGWRDERASGTFPSLQFASIHTLLKTSSLLAACTVDTSRFFATCGQQQESGNHETMRCALTGSIVHAPNCTIGSPSPRPVPREEESLVWPSFPSETLAEVFCSDTVLDARLLLQLVVNTLNCSSSNINISKTGKSGWFVWQGNSICSSGNGGGTSRKDKSTPYNTVLLRLVLGNLCHIHFLYKSFATSAL